VPGGENGGVKRVKIKQGIEKVCDVKEMLLGGTTREKGRLKKSEENGNRCWEALGNKCKLARFAGAVTRLVVGKGSEDLETSLKARLLIIGSSEGKKKRRLDKGGFEQDVRRGGLKKFREALGTKYLNGRRTKATGSSRRGVRKENTLAGEGHSGSKVQKSQNRTGGKFGEGNYWLDWSIEKKKRDHFGGV